MNNPRQRQGLGDQLQQYVTHPSTSPVPTYKGPTPQQTMSLPPIMIYQALAANSTLTIKKNYDHPIVITEMNIKFNSGCQDLLIYLITNNNQAIFDFQNASGATTINGTAANNILFGDNETLFWQGWLQFPIIPNQIVITITNMDSFAHTIKFLLDVQKLL